MTFDPPSSDVRKRCKSNSNRRGSRVWSRTAIRPACRRLGERLARALTNDPPDVVARIEQLEQAVQSGTFEASSSEVAESIIDARARTADRMRTDSLSSLSFESGA